MNNFRNLFSSSVLIIGIISYTSLTLASEKTPNKIVTEFHKVLLWSMKNAKTLDRKDRYKKIAPKIEQSFHFPLMTQVSAGSIWRKASKEQAKKLISAFTHFSISTYASQFESYKGQSFVINSEKAGPQKTILVKTQIITTETKPINITYVTQKIKQRWRIIDVLLGNGISQLAVRRSEYRQILKKSGLNELIATLNAKADQLLFNQTN